MRTRAARLGTMLLVAACSSGISCSGGGGDGGGGGVVNPPPGNPPPAGNPVSALEDASTRLIAGLAGSCLSGVTTALTALRAKMSPSRTATSADVQLVRTALAQCPDDATAADRDEIGLALDVADDVIAGR